MKKTLRILVMALIIMLCIPMKLQASDCRKIWKVVEGTAKKVGTTTEITVEEGFLEQWEANHEKIEGLTANTTDKLLKADNLEKLPITVEKISYHILKQLAKEAAGEEKEIECVYQGYAQLNLEDAKSGYTFGGSIAEVDGKNIFTGYYANGKEIYHVKLVLEKTSWSEISQVKQIVEKTEEGEIEKNSGSDFEFIPEPTPKPTSEPTPIPQPTPTPEPEPEPDPDTPIIVPDDPIIPLPTN